MKKSIITAALLMLFATVSAVALAQGPELPTPTKEHEWLKQFVGEWESEAEASMGPSQTVKCSGTMSYRMLGDFWLFSDQKAELPGIKIEAVQTLGYDPKSQKYVGTWVDSVSNHMWQYEGTVDETGKIITLEAEGPSFTQPGKMGKYRDIYEFKSADEFATRSEMLGEDGKWVAFMTGTAKRKK